MQATATSDDTPPVNEKTSEAVSKVLTVSLFVLSPKYVLVYLYLRLMVQRERKLNHTLQISRRA